ncbi:MAG TPA: class I SAM-dependent methyltransferase [Ktedonobacteraceae bacterium]
MSAAEDVVRLTDSIHAFLAKLDCTLQARWKQSFISFPAGTDLMTSIEQEQDELVQQYLLEVTQFLDDSYALLTELDTCLSPRERQACLLYHRSLLLPFFLQSQFVRRALDKPLGYAGDYGVNEMLFDNKENGLSPLAKLLSHYALNTGPAKAHRNRMPWAHAHLWQKMRDTAEKSMRVLSFACGPERILREFSLQGGTCEITLCDADNRALEYCRRDFNKIARKTGASVPIHPVELSATRLLKDPTSVEALQQPTNGEGYDMILVLGLLDYLPAPAVTNLIDILTTLLKPGGDILLTNVHSRNPWRSFMEYIGEWRVIAREEREFSDLALGNPSRLRLLELITDESGTNLYFAGRR